MQRQSECPTLTAPWHQEASLGPVGFCGRRSPTFQDAISHAVPRAPSAAGTSLARCSERTIVPMGESCGIVRRYQRELSPEPASEKMSAALTPPTKNRWLPSFRPLVFQSFRSGCRRWNWARSPSRVSRCSCIRNSTRNNRAIGLDQSELSPPVRSDLSRSIERVPRGDPHRPHVMTC
jgi:hypothetical protein